MHASHRTLGLALISLAATSCAPTAAEDGRHAEFARPRPQPDQLEDHAIIAISARKENGVLVLRFEACDTGKPTSILSVMITRKDPPFACVLRNDVSPVLRTWRYPEEVPGYIADGCLPLETGSSYHIGVLGDGRGDLGIRLGSDDQVYVVGDSCERRDGGRE